MKSPKASSPAVTNVMKANKGRNTNAEKYLRKYLHSSGLRYAIDARPEKDISSRADIVFRSAKVAIYVHGCFWHGCPKHYKSPKTNRKYWNWKRQTNQARDKRTKRLLTKRGWKVIVYWEHQDVSKYGPNLVRIVKERRTSYSPARR